MQHSDSRILTTHVGSLVRTPQLVELEIQKFLGESVDPATYTKALHEGVNEVVAHQQRIGIDIVDDGEYGKLNWITYLGQRLQGLTTTDLRLKDEEGAAIWPEQARYGEFYKAYQRVETAQWLPSTPSLPKYTANHMTDYVNVVCRGPLVYNPAPVLRDIENLRAAAKASGATQVFMPVVAPGSIETVPNQHYATQEDYLFALADELNKEYRLIVDSGFILQVDDAAVAGNYYARFLGRPLSEYLAWAEIRIDALNRALRGIPEDRVRLHMCFGSQNVPHTTDPALRDIIGLLLKARTQGYLIEASNPRHEHEWRIWRDVKLPAGKVLMPGVVSHATNIVEHPELIAMRICNFAELVGRENVVASTDCGFSQGWNSPRVHAQVQWAKLESLVEGARIATRTLWGKAAA
jgi:5-methyltetrahydropteroyltriglutamate--homocysteine methyltransferase